MGAYKFWELIPDGVVIMGGDISIRSTGIAVVSKEGIQYLGTYKLNRRSFDTDTDIQNRLKKHFVNKIEKYSVTDVVYEDIFQGVNPKNNRTFAVLNSTFEKIIAEGLCDIKQERLVNTVWKSQLQDITKEIAGVLIKHYANHKENTRKELKALGFYIPDDLPDDISDALAMVLVHVVNTYGNVIEKTGKVVKENNNFSVGKEQGYHVLFTQDYYVTDDLAMYPDTLDVERTKYVRDLGNTIITFFKNYNANCILLVEIGDYSRLGFDLRKYDVVQELNGLTDLVAIVCKKSWVSSKLKSIKVSERVE